MSNNLPLVSIVALSYNQNSYCIETLKSISEQSYKNIEVIIIDDYSTDNSVFLIKQWLGQTNLNYSFITHSKNCGIPFSLNEALKLCKGKYYRAIACDDILTTDSIEVCVNVMEPLNSNIGFCASDMKLINSNNEIIKESVASRRQMFDYSSSSNLYDELLRKFELSAPAIFYRIEVFNKVGIYDESFDIEDRDILLRISKHFSMIYIDKPLVFYRIHNESFSYDFTRFKMVKSCVKIYSKLLNDETNTIKNKKIIVYTISNYILRVKQQGLLNMLSLQKEVFKEIRYNPLFFHIFYKWFIPYFQYRLDKVYKRIIVKFNFF